MTALGVDGRRAVAEDLDDDERPASGGHACRGVLVCFHVPPCGNISAEWTYWDSRRQARQAAAELTPCGPLCIGVHSVVRVDVVPEPRRRAGLHRP
jgi:hypothetical protein